MITSTKPLYRTRLGQAFVGDSLGFLDEIGSNSIDLVITSPPFALQRQKEYGNKNQKEYVDWLLSFIAKVKRVLKETGSFVLDLGGAYEKGRPVRSIYNYRILVRACDELGLRLPEEFFWFNPAKLPSPIEWVNKRKIRVKDSVNTIWWFSKSDFPKADVKKVLVPYSDRMQQLLKNASKFYKPKSRPSGHDISLAFDRNNEGAIPPNLLAIPNTESNSKYIRLCKTAGVESHPARFPVELPTFFIQFLTDPGDLVLDIFAGSNATGEAAEKLDRKWIALDMEHPYLATSAFRFVDELNPQQARDLYSHLMETPSVDDFIAPGQTSLMFVSDRKASYSEQKKRPRL
jgi:site-specific DNA-methyltransferase (cytosine-N4-specific)